MQQDFFAQKKRDRLAGPLKIRNGLHWLASHRTIKRVIKSFYPPVQ